MMIEERQQITAGRCFSSLERDLGNVAMSDRVDKNKKGREVILGVTPSQALSRILINAPYLRTSTAISLKIQRIHLCMIRISSVIR